MDNMNEDFKEVKHKNDDVTFHDKETGEPLFVGSKHYGRSMDAKWHPHMLKTHPGLNDSYEFNSPYLKKMKGDNKSELSNRIGWHYNEAARKGFQDEIPHTARTLTSDEIENLHKEYKSHHGHEFAEYTSHPEQYHNHVTFHDPDTNERIGVVKFHPENRQSMFHHDVNYAKNNNISDDMKGIAQNEARTRDNAELPYEYSLARAMYHKKGKVPRLTGIESTKGYNSFKVNGDPAAASLAHENYITGKHEGVTVQRHSPTSFVANRPAGRSQGRIIHSHIIDNILHSTESEYNEPDYAYRGKNTIMIESVLS